MQRSELQKFIIEQLMNIKAQDIISIDVSKKSSITDSMIICTGRSNRHLTSISDKLIKACYKIGITPLSVEGRNVSNWVIVDLGDAIVHIMQADTRNIYKLEKLWNQI